MKILLLADIHIGSIKDTSYVYNVLTEIIDDNIIMKKCDLIVILGDYFHRLFKVNEEFVSVAINVMSYLIRACLRNNTKIRIVYGTESHEMGQYKLFNYHMTSTHIDMKVIETATEETINGESILYLPEEYIDDKHEFYKDALYSDKHYNYIFGHGVIVEGMPAMVSLVDNSSIKEKQVPRFKSGELSSKSDICVFGHYHVYTDIGDNVYYLGSLFRDSFGEEDPKGYGIIDKGKFTFIENKRAYTYKTYEFDTSSDIYNDNDRMIQEINRIKKENKDIFDGIQTGKIRLVFKTPKDVNDSFKETIHNLLSNDKYIAPLIKESNDELIDEVKDEIEDEYDFILDNSMNIIDKIYRYMNKQHEGCMTLETLKSYIQDVII